MAYSELIKNFGRIRGYMKEFYIYGFKTRGEYDGKSPRSYDNERRRIESYLNDYMGFRQTQDGKNVFLSIDSRSSRRNPLYKALKAKSFTDGDITLHFILLDILYAPDVSLTLGEITEKIDEAYLSSFSSQVVYDESTVRKKLKEYTQLGLIRMEKQGKKVYYNRAENPDISGMKDAVEFFSEAGGCGAIGSFLLDREENTSDYFSFKHHYINGALDSEVLCQLFQAIHAHESVALTYNASRGGGRHEQDVVPLKIYVSTQNGRQYLLAYHIRYHRIIFYRLDYIECVKPGKKDGEDQEELFQLALKRYELVKQHLWGVTIGKNKKTEHVEFTIHMEDDEEYIYHRLLREKRIGEVTRVDKNTCVFSADVYDTSEMLPWIRTFICRITRLNFSNRTVENKFKKDIEEMYRLYDMGGGA